MTRQEFVNKWIKVITGHDDIYDAGHTPETVDEAFQKDLDKLLRDEYKRGYDRADHGHLDL